MSKATKQQLVAIHATLHKKNLLKFKAEIIAGATNDRSTSSKDLTMEEAAGILTSLNPFQPTDKKKDTGPMIRKLFAMAHEMGWITRTSVVTQCGIIEKNDNKRVYDWVEKYGYLKKPLRKYSYAELPKLISAFEFHIYKPYLENLK